MADSTKSCFVAIPGVGVLIVGLCVVCTLLTSTSQADELGKGLPVYMAREFTGLSVQEVADLAQRALEGRRFSVTDIAKDHDEVVIETYRSGNLMLAGGNLIMRLTTNPEGRVRATIAVEDYTTASGMVARLWDDLDTLVVKSGGCTWKSKRSGEEFGWCRDTKGWVAANAISGKQLAARPDAQKDDGPVPLPATEHNGPSNNGHAPETTDIRRFCIECGQGIPTDAKFCPYCGRKQGGVD